MFFVLPPLVQTPTLKLGGRGEGKLGLSSRECWPIWIAKIQTLCSPLSRPSDQSTAMNIATQCVSQLQIDSISIALTPPNLTGRSGSQKYTLFCSPLLPPEWSIHRNEHCNSVCEPVCSAVTPPHPAYPSCHQCTWQLHDNLHDNSFSYAKLSHSRGTLLLNK